MKLFALVFSLVLLPTAALACKPCESGVDPAISRSDTVVIATLQKALPKKEYKDGDEIYFKLNVNEVLMGDKKLKELEIEQKVYRCEPVPFIPVKSKKYVYFLEQDKNKYYMQRYCGSDPLEVAKTNMTELKKKLEGKNER